MKKICILYLDEEPFFLRNNNEHGLKFEIIAETDVYSAKSYISRDEDC